ncbi:hypothetical protein, partial [Thiolapillus sp.]|uniref:hypothetical protein n=3 Tax=Thiolapillus sp. TaxID=2017437 RepID=UPI003AF9F3FC
DWLLRHLPGKSAGPGHSVIENHDLQRQGSSHGNQLEFPLNNASKVTRFGGHALSGMITKQTSFSRKGLCGGGKTNQKTAVQTA